MKFWSACSSSDDANSPDGVWQSQLQNIALESPSLWPTQSWTGRPSETYSETIATSKGPHVSSPYCDHPTIRDRIQLPAIRTSIVGVHSDQWYRLNITTYGHEPFRRVAASLRDAHVPRLESISIQTPLLYG